MIPQDPRVNEPSLPLPAHRRLAVRLGIYASLLLVLSTSVIGGLSYRRSAHALEERFGDSLQRIVGTAALAIDGDAHARIRTMADTTSPEFIALREQLRAVQQVNGLREDLLLTAHVVNESSTTAAVMLQETPYTGDGYDIPAANRAAYRAATVELRPAHTGLYRDAHGDWISAVAPILDSQGRLAGILNADIEVTAYRAALRSELLAVLATCSVAVLIALLGSLTFGRRLEETLARIRAGAEAIEHERYDHRIALESRDELGLIASWFNRMAEVLSERFELLKFLPDYTVDAVQRRAAGSGSLETERVDAAILFSDIRGYTALSEGMPDERVVTMLNVYLRRQTELIEEHGGVIDKFIGDAVLAVFRGPERARGAVQAALAIQESVAELNADGVFERPVTIGIGIASGSLVLAEIGSEDRRERTLIGSVVNLASRLCGRAGSGEVIVSDDVLAGVTDHVRVTLTEHVPLKGFSDAQPCHTVERAGS